MASSPTLALKADPYTFLLPTLIVLSLPDDSLNLCLKSGVHYKDNPLKMSRNPAKNDGWVKQQKGKLK